MRVKPQQRFALCLDNAEHPASLERWKIYRVLPDSEAAKHRQLRVVDESGEDYLYSRAYFKPLRLSPALARLYPHGLRRNSRKNSRRSATIRTPTGRV